ncbi:TRAP transporter small permease [Falsiroseomonas selenitidurans]|uniref:TRAP transporter small permease protein n=1 Tax=Falsiroseomonas selenitidurans TaxID=2716335 RepID=A0ABX1DZF3_9PROT|nr:TRAP transporter small permease subunit [Falsiroseomonas selenitidurans]NKC30290.1 TRAP transporter small permease subunit [Falsiroseomonas selenitidurans]
MAESKDAGDPPRGPLGGIARAMAFLGGVSLLVAATVTTISVVLRWTTSQPIRGDFEMVSIASGVAVFGFLGYGTLMRANILVDTFTTWLPRRVAGLFDAFWMLVWAALTLWLAERMALGAWETWANGMRTIGLLALPYWWAVAIGALAFAVTGLAALLWAGRFARGRF